MKKVFIAACILLSLASVLPQQVRAVDISVGPVVWYAWWTPMFKNFFSGDWKNIPTGYRVMLESGPTVHANTHWSDNGSFLFGPAISIKFSEKWTFASVFTMSSSYRQSGGFEVISTTISENPTKFKISKYDLDATLSYNLTKILKLFGGFKYQGYAYKGTYDSFGIDTSSSTSIISRQKIDSNSNGYGAGLGIGITYPLHENLYLLGNVSGVYLRTLIDHKIDVFSLAGTSVTLNTYRQYFNVGGLNSSLALAYYIPAASITISAGGRFQVLKYYSDKVDTDSLSSDLNVSNYSTKSVREIVQSRVLLKTFNNVYDYFYGATLSVTYMFQI